MRKRMLEVCLLTLLSFALTLLYFAKISFKFNKPTEVTYSALTPAQLKKIEDFANLLQSSGMPKELSSQELLQGALSGMGSMLDQYSEYYPPEKEIFLHLNERYKKDEDENLIFSRLEEDIAYIQIKLFTKSVKDNFEKEWRKLKEGGEIRRIILDLRNNPGGLIKISIFVAEFFLREDLIIVRREERYKIFIEVSDYPDATDNLQMVVLVNASSASASEILAKALQSNERATIIGQQSFGKGSEQAIIPQEDGSAFRYTDAVLYGPRGEIINKIGVIPDIVVEENDLILARAIEFLKK